MASAAERSQRVNTTLLIKRALREAGWDVQGSKKSQRGFLEVNAKDAFF